MHQQTQISRKFSKVMMEGKMKAAFRLIANDNTGRLLHVDTIIDPSTPSESVHDILLKKHPPKQRLKEETMINRNTPVIEPHSIIFEQIDDETALPLKWMKQPNLQLWAQLHGNGSLLHSNQPPPSYVTL